MASDDEPCPFCAAETERICHEAKDVLGVWDGFPVTPGHALLVPRRHVATWFQASQGERHPASSSDDSRTGRYRANVGSGCGR
jgi:hypothetical protein